MLIFPLNKSQSDALSDFCNDVAKGLFLGIAINHLLATGVPAATKILISIFAIIISISFLYIALFLKRTIS